MLASVRRKRLFGRTGLNLHPLGFGLMRIPKSSRQEDIEEAVRLIHEAIDRGINFFDTAQVYKNGLSEYVLGEAVRGRRDKVIISTKTPWKHESVESFPRFFERSLQNLQTAFVDCYAIHSLTWKKYTEKVRTSEGILSHLLQLKIRGKIRHIGFSSHDKPENIKKLLETGRFEFVILQYSLLDRRNKDIIKFASDSNVGLAIMGPLAGGKIPSFGPRLPGKYGQKSEAFFADLGLRFVLADLDVTCCLCGMTNRDMLSQNHLTCEQGLALTERECKIVEQMQATCDKIMSYYCTACGYCMPCPNGVPIPQILELYAYYRLQGALPVAKEEYRSLRRLHRFSCKECRLCVCKCPQGTDVTTMLKNAEGLFTTILPAEEE